MYSSDILEKDSHWMRTYEQHSKVSANVALFGSSQHPTPNCAVGGLSIQKFPLCSDYQKLNPPENLALDFQVSCQTHSSSMVSQGTTHTPCCQQKGRHFCIVVSISPELFQRLRQCSFPPRI